MAQSNCGGDVVKIWQGYFLRNDLEIRKAANMEPQQAYSLFQEKPYQRIKIFTGSLDWAITESEKLLTQN